MRNDVHVSASQCQYDFAFRGEEYSDMLCAMLHFADHAITEIIGINISRISEIISSITSRDLWLFRKSLTSFLFLFVNSQAIISGIHISCIPWIKILYFLDLISLGKK